MKKIFVAGASGFIGGQIATHLSEKFGDAEILAGFHSNPKGIPQKDRVKPVEIDVEQISTLEKALANVDALVICVGGSRYVSVNGVAALLAAAATCKVKTAVYVSCTSIYGLACDTVTETTEPCYDEHTNTAYDKAEAESVCREYTGRGLPVTILRSANVLGPGGMTEWAKTLTRRLHSRKWGRIGQAGEGTANLVDVRDLAAAVACALRVEQARGKVFNINGPDQMSWNDVFSAYNTAMSFPYTRDITGDSIGLRVLGAGPWRFAQKNISFMRNKANQSLLAVPSFLELDTYRLKTVYSNEAARRDLKWEPSIKAKQSINDTAEWAKEHKTAWLA